MNKDIINLPTAFTLGELECKVIIDNYLYYTLNGKLHKAKLCNEVKFKACDNKWYFLYDAKRTY